MITTEYDSYLSWCRQCPELVELWAVSGNIDGTEENVIDITDTASLYENITSRYTDGEKRVSGIPTSDYWETITVTLYRPYFPQNNALNLDDIYDRCVGICDWFINQQNNEMLPVINQKQIHFIEVLSPKPIKQWFDSDIKTLAYNVAIRLHQENPAKRCDYVI